MLILIVIMPTGFEQPKQDKRIWTRQKVKNEKMGHDDVIARSIDARPWTIEKPQMPSRVAWAELGQIQHDEMFTFTKPACAGVLCTPWGMKIRL